MHSSHEHGWPEDCLHVGIWQHVYSLLPFALIVIIWGLLKTQKLQTSTTWDSFSATICTCFIHSFSKYLVSTCSLQGHGSLGICGWIGDAPLYQGVSRGRTINSSKRNGIKGGFIVLKTAKQAE